MQYIDQHHNALRLYVTIHPLPEKQFSVIAEHLFDFKEYNIALGILSESHYVTIHHNNNCLTEIFACSDADISYEIKKSFTELTEPVTVELNDLTYSFTTSTVSFSAGASLLAALHQKRALPEVHYLAHEFPTVTPKETPGQTEIYITTTGDQFIIQSIHSYPNEDVMVFTTSHLQTH
jgi:hypothetical protein